MGGYSIVNTSKRPLTYNGAVTHQTLQKSRSVNAIPITISYQLDVYTRYLYEADAYIRDLVFNLINHPIVNATIPYKSINKIHSAKITLASDITDNSDIPERLIRDSFSRQTISFYIDGQLFDYKPYDNWKIDCCNSTLLLNDEELKLANNSIDINIKENK